MLRDPVLVPTKRPLSMLFEVHALQTSGHILDSDPEKYEVLAKSLLDPVVPSLTKAEHGMKRSSQNCG